MKIPDYCRILTVFLVCAFVFSLHATPSYAKTREEINASVKAAMDRFEMHVKGSTAYLKGAKGVLVMPGITKAGFGIGGEYGRGALMVAGETVNYYSLVEGSVGWQIGVQQFDMIILFMTDDVLNKFRKSGNWEAGLDAEITVITVGADATVETLRSQHPIAGFIFNQKGLMGGVTVKGAKFTRIHPE